MSTDWVELIHIWIQVCFYQHILNSDQLTPVWSGDKKGKRLFKVYFSTSAGAAEASPRFPQECRTLLPSGSAWGSFQDDLPHGGRGHFVRCGAAPVVIGLDVLCHTGFSRVHSPLGPRCSCGVSDTQVTRGGARPWASLSKLAAFLGWLLF